MESEATRRLTFKQEVHHLWAHILSGRQLKNSCKKTVMKYTLHHQATCEQRARTLFHITTEGDVRCGENLPSRYGYADVYSGIWISTTKWKVIRIDKLTKLWHFDLPSTLITRQPICQRPSLHDKYSVLWSSMLTATALLVLRNWIERNSVFRKHGPYHDTLRCFFF